MPFCSQGVISSARRFAKAEVRGASPRESTILPLCLSSYRTSFVNLYSSVRVRPEAPFQWWSWCNSSITPRDGVGDGANPFGHPNFNLNLASSRSAVRGTGSAHWLVRGSSEVEQRSVNRWTWVRIPSSQVRGSEASAAMRNSKAALRDSFTRFSRCQRVVSCRGLSFRVAAIRQNATIRKTSTQESVSGTLPSRR